MKRCYETKENNQQCQTLKEDDTIINEEIIGIRN